jgi:hypothetical protein
LQPSDFTFLGTVRPPSHAVGGNLAGKTENGQTSLYMLTHHSDDGGRLYEMPYTGNASLQNPPTLTATFRGWPAWNGKTLQAVSWDYKTGALRSYRHPALGNQWPFHGLAYHQGKLYISYLDYYNSDYGTTDHCLIVADLTQTGDSRTSSAYRFRNHGSVKRICGGLFVTPQGLGMGASMMAISRNFDNAWGPSFSVLPWNAISHNGGFNSAPLAVSPRLSHAIDNPASRASDYRPHIENPSNPDGPLPPPGRWTQRDRMNVFTWIETTSGKRGVVAMGGMATGQVWYGHFSSGPGGAVNECQSAERGENADTFRPEWRIYDPVKLTGGRPEPDHIFDPRSRPNAADWMFHVCEAYFTGAYFDRASGLLFAASGAHIGVWRVQ